MSVCQDICVRLYFNGKMQKAIGISKDYEEKYIYAGKFVADLESPLEFLSPLLKLKICSKIFVLVFQDNGYNIICKKDGAESDWKQHIINLNEDDSIYDGDLDCFAENEYEGDSGDDPAVIREAFDEQYPNGTLREYIEKVISNTEDYSWEAIGNDEDGEEDEEDFEEEEEDDEEDFEEEEEEEEEETLIAEEESGKNGLTSADAAEPVDFSDAVVIGAGSPFVRKKKPYRVKDNACMIEKFQKLVIDDTISEIGYQSFDACRRLTAVRISGSVKIIGIYAFYGCDHLTHVELQEGVTEIRCGVFRNCSSLKSIVIPASVKVIDEQAFLGCTNLREVIILADRSAIQISEKALDPDSTAKIIFRNEENAAGQPQDASNQKETRMTAPKTFVVPDGCTEIRAGDVPEDCACVIIPPGVTKIGNEAFYGNTALTDIEIPDTVTEIGDSAFEGCTGLFSIVIPDSVTEIGITIFCGCSRLTNVILSENLYMIAPGMFSGCTALTSIKIPSGVGMIGMQAFAGCSSLTEIALPPGADVDPTAFNDCPAGK